MTTPKIDKYTARMNSIALENKIKMIPTTIKETYSDLVHQNPVLISRELIADNHVMLGVEYAPDGTAVRAYTTDSKGKKIGITNIDEKVNYEDYGLRDMIAEHFEKISNINESKKVKETTKSPAEQTFKVQKTKVSEKVAEYVNRHGKTKG